MVAYRRLTRRRTLFLCAMVSILALTLVLDIGSGAAGLGPLEVIRAIALPSAADDQVRAIVWEIRLPIGIMAVLVGAALALAGAEMQTILNNPLASPFTLGISAAASFGASAAVVFQVSLIPAAGNLVITTNAFAFAMIAALLIYGFSRMRGASAETMVLIGIGLSFVFSALLAMMQYFAPEQALAQIVFWTLGSLGRSTWAKVAIVAAVLVATIPYFISQSWKLTALRLGEDKARSLGIDTQRLRLHVLIVVSLLAAVSVAFVGTIGFVGLAGPHIARMLVGEDQRSFVPASMIGGALLMSVASIISKSVFPGVLLPVGIVTSVVGMPFFFGIVMARRRQLW